MEMERSAYRDDIAYDFCAVQDKNLIEDSLWASAQKMNDYDAKLDLVYMAQLMTPEFITGSDLNEYLVTKCTFDTFLTATEKIYEDRRAQFETFNDELVKSASTRIAREVKLAIEAYRADEAQKELCLENLASELFVLETNQPLKSDNDNCPF